MFENLFAIQWREASNQAILKANLKTTKNLKPAKPIANKTTIFHNIAFIIIAFFAIPYFNQPPVPNFQLSCLILLTL